MFISILQADELRAAVGVPPSKPIDVEVLAKRLGCDVEYCELGARGGGIEAALLPDSLEDRFVVRVDATPPSGWGGLTGSARRLTARHRRRFRIAHELAHTCFYARQVGHPPRRIAPLTHEEELLCDEIARAILVPPKSASALPPVADSAFQIASRFDVSLEVGARALAAAHPGLTAALWFWRPSKSPAQSSLLRQWSNVAHAASLRSWRVSAIAKTALEVDGTADGLLPSLDDCQEQGRGRATARADRDRRQLLVVRWPQNHEGNVLAASSD
jgi:hypothetical protein